VERIAPDGGVLGRGARVAVAVSGGSDSVALYRLLLGHERSLGIEVVGLLHVNHQLRGAAAEADERFCRELAAATGRVVHVERVEVVRGSGPDRRSPEHAAREVRYAALERGRLALSAGLVALGHTRDDQAETVLFRLLRGAGPDGLQGIHPARGPFVRPVLGLTRQQLRDYLATVGQGWVEDATNAELSVPRNLLRHKVLPALEDAVPGAGRTLARHAAIARDEAGWLAGLVNPVVERHVHTRGGSILVDGALAGEPTALGRRVVLVALRRAGARQPGLDEVEAVRELLGAASGGRQLPGGLRANRIEGGVVLTKGGVGHHAPRPAYRYSLEVPGSIEVPEASAVVGAFAREQAPDADPVDAIEVNVDSEGLGASVTVRNWRPGDLIRPAGLGGRKKLQDVFVDGKLPRENRARLPLVVDAADRVLWVPGLAIDERLRVTSGSKAVVVLRLTRKQPLPVGGPE
jgi:tRNA(Ile)-lysidine synthase